MRKLQTLIIILALGLLSFSDTYGMCRVEFGSTNGHDYNVSISNPKLNIVHHWTGGFNYTVSFDYEISYDHAPTIYYLVGYVYINNKRSEFPLNSRSSGKYGTSTYTATASGDYRHATLETMLVGDIDIYLEANGIGSVTESCSNTLPIVLKSFQAMPSARGIDVTWETYSEKDNDYFTLERSSDGKIFSEIATIPGAGNSNKVLSYEHEDIYAPTGILYYRLKQTDFNGDFEYFKIVNTNNITGTREAWPNPFVDNVNIPSSGDAKMVLVGSLSGKTIESHYTSLNGNIQVNDLMDLSPGVYFITIVYKDRKEVHKVIKI